MWLRVPEQEALGFRTTAEHGLTDRPNDPFLTS